MNRKNIKLTIGYDGTDFCGWQMNGHNPSIEEELKKALEKLLQEEITLQAASRTDAGVHAQGQVVNFFTTNEKLTLTQLTKGLNALLPKTIVVFSAQEMNPDFHPSLHAQKKTYTYDLCYGKVQLPHLRKYSWHMPYPLDIEEMQRAKSHFLGKQDFSAFCNTHPNQRYSSKEREIISTRIHDLPNNHLQFEITGNHFLYKMARNIVGTLVHVGAGKLQAEEMPLILASKSRPKAGITAPAHGLSLKEIYYQLDLILR